MALRSRVVDRSELIVVDTRRSVHAAHFISLFWSRAPNQQRSDHSPLYPNDLPNSA
jgi:hypothetical protein